MSKSMYREAELIDLTDEQLLDTIAFLYESLKKCDEEMNDDEHIKRVTDELKAYKQEKYLDVKKAYRAKLKAARYIAQAKGLQFTLPAGVEIE